MSRFSSASHGFSRGAHGRRITAALLMDRHNRKGIENCHNIAREKRAHTMSG